MNKSSIPSDFSPKTILVTGGCGFIGSNFIRYLISLDESFRIINVDALTYAGNMENLSDCLDHPCHKFVKGNICDVNFISQIFDKYKPDAVVNFAAESHVDRSIENPQNFFEVNVGGTLVMLDLSLKHKVKRYVQVSTDEVYGSLGDTGKFTEKTQISPNSPYSASKASADMLVRIFNKTYGLN